MADLMQQTTALADTEFAELLALLGPFERSPRLAVGVSGGADSTALAVLAHSWAKARGGCIAALVVDHGLRPGSASEAANVAAALARRGIRSRVLPWLGPKPAGGLQAAARTARRRLLETACREMGILHLLLAHHAQDQAETVAMRAARGSGPAGRAGMPAVSELAGLRLLRPLLSVPPARLRATLVACGEGWIEDPSNLDPRFARARFRQDPQFGAGRWIEEGRTEARARAAHDVDLATQLARSVRPHRLGFVRLPAMAAGPAMLARLLVTVGGQVYPPPAALLCRIVAQLQSGRDWRASAGGCLLNVHDGVLLIAREPGRVRDRARLNPGGRALWDGRFEVRYEDGMGPLELARLGESGHGILPIELRRRLRAEGVPAAAVAALPALFADGIPCACPPLGFCPAASLRVDARLRSLVPLAAPAFAGANVVSNPHRLIYPAPTGVLPRAGSWCGPG